MENLTQEIFAFLFDTKRTPRAWKNKSVDLELLQKIYNHSKFGPTSANCSPLRVVFVHSKEGKEKLKPCLDPGNIDQTMNAPITAIFAYDLDFYTHMDRLYPHTNARAWFEGNEPLIKETAFRNATLQAAYFMISARGFGLDCGPMSGFKAALLDETFLKGTKYKSNFLCNLGYGDTSNLKPRDWRFPFDEISRIV